VCVYCCIKLVKTVLVVETVADDVNNFLLRHDENSIKDVGVDKIRQIIPKLFMYRLGHDLTSCRKGLFFIGFLLFVYLKYWQ